jgi:hypothetical protein
LFFFCFSFLDVYFLGAEHSSPQELYIISVIRFFSDYVTHFPII